MSTCYRALSCYCHETNGAPACSQVLSTNDMVTRESQMRMRITKKKKKSSSSLNKKGKKRKGKKAGSGNAKMLKSPPMRRRSVMARNKATSSSCLGETEPASKISKADELAVVEEPWHQAGWADDEWWGDDWWGDSWWTEKADAATKGRKRNASHKATKQDSGKTRPKASPKAKTKAAAKAKATAKKKAKAAPKPKAKAKSKAKAKAAPKAKGKAKAKASAARANTAATAAAWQNDDHTIAEWMATDYRDVIFDHVQRLRADVDKDLPTFKTMLREELPLYEMTRLNVYWSRRSCGLTMKATGKDLVTFACSGHKIPCNLEIAIVIQCASMLAPGRHSGSSAVPQSAVF